VGAYLKTLIGIASYPEAERNGMNKAMMDTWLRGDTGDYMFFIPEFVYPSSMKSCHIVSTRAHDTYEDYFRNFQLACGYILLQGYDYLFWCDRDTYVRPENFPLSRFDHYDYVGYPLEHPDCPIYASGGAGRWFSRKALEVIMNSKQEHFHADISVGISLARAGIKLWADPRYFIWRVPITKHNGMIAVHLSQGTKNYDPDWMYDTHKEWENS
jgi:hypothetical protein